MMKKFSDVYQMTREFLNGKLEKFSMNYKNENCLVISVKYEDDYDYRYDYDVEIVKDGRVVNFLGHNGTSVLCKIKLDRNQDFENAICNYICNGVK
jgi:hypothetical protein